MLKKFLIPLLLFSSLPADEVTHLTNGGREYDGTIWPNPREDWQIKSNWFANTHSGGDRNVVSLISEITGPQPFTTTAKIKPLSEKLTGKGWVGLQIGLRGPQHDYREAAIYGVGIPAGLNHKGQLFIGNSRTDNGKPELLKKEFTLVLSGKNTAEGYSLTISVNSDGEMFSHTTDQVDPRWLPGLLALTSSSRPINQIDISKKRPETSYGGVAFGRVKEDQTKLKPLNQGRGDDFRFAFKDWKISGAAVKHHPKRHFGPIWWAAHTVDQNQQLRLLAQIAPTLSFPLYREVALFVELEIDGKTFEALLDEPFSYTSLFKVPLSDTSIDHPYTLKFKGYEKSGIVRAIPTGDKPVTVASLSCNDSTGFPHDPLVANVTAHKPDVITFHGDQIYEGIGGYGYVQTQKPDHRSVVCYLRKYAMHGWSWRHLLMTTPSITIPDDHDIFHGNLWGEGGKLADMSKATNNDHQDSGGYKMSPLFVNMVHKTQTGNLPKAKEQPVCKNGISTYHTSFQYGPLDFLVLADRQFKSAPKAILPKAQINNGWPQNLEWNAKTEATVKDAQLLGPMQEAFLEKWASTPTEKSPFRILISQSPFLAPQTLPKDMHHDKGVPGLPVYKVGEYAPNDEPKPDFDTNGWPQDKQKVAVRSLKKAGAVHIVGDQHLGTTGRYGVDDYNDGSWWIATPATANVWPRRWMPQVKPIDRKEGTSRWLGKFEDGFGNKFELHAVANPHDINREPSRLFDRAVGYSITTYDLKTKTITLANWPYTSGPQHQGDEAKPYPGWPITIRQ